MSETTYRIPGDVDELFANGEAQYQICDPDHPGDNLFAMELFLESVDVPEQFIEEDDGTQVVLSNGSARLCIDSYGLGDFHLHGYDVTVMEADNADD